MINTNATTNAPRTYSTGRKITLDLDNLGNAAIWQIFQIVTDGTNNVFRGDEEDASPAADTDAATEIFVHVAETAEERAQGADAAQAAWLLGTREEYHEIFEEYPEEQATEVYLDPKEYDQGILEEIAEEHGLLATVYNCFTPAPGGGRDEILVTGTDAARLVRAYDEERAGAPTCEERDDDPDEATEEAADFDAMVQAWRDDPAHENIDAALEANATDTTNAPSNLYRAGVFAGLAEAAAWMIYDGVTTDDADDINAITAAIYKAYGVAW